MDDNRCHRYCGDSVRFGSLVVRRDSGKWSHGVVVLGCDCDCGGTHEVTSKDLRCGHVKSCGCIGVSMFKDLTGKRFGRLLILSRAGSAKGYVTWNYRCDCGNSGIASSRDLLRGSKKSCNCLRVENQSRLRPRTIHGHAASQNGKENNCSKEYRAWTHIKHSCSKEKSDAHKKYRKVGTGMDSAWKESFQAFLQDVGPAPSEDCWLIRIDKSKGYFRGNVKWGKPVEAKWKGLSWLIDR